MAKTRISRVHNIPESIILQAERLGLDAMSTGGNMDYIYKEIGKNQDGSDRVVLLASANDAGSPDKLTDKCDLNIMLNEEWNDMISIPMSNVRAGLIVMASMQDPNAIHRR